MKAVNLLPTELRGAAPAPAKPAAPQHSGGSGSYIVLGALALSVAGLAGWVLTGNTIEQRKAELVVVNDRKEAAETRAAQLKPYADFASLASERLTTVHQLAGSRFRWEQALRDISYALPTDVTVKTLDATIASGVAGGSSPLRGAIDAPAIELTGCTSSQQSVARMMSRLRAVNGVTRVSLSRSDKGEKDMQAPDAAAPVAGFGGADVKPEGCAGKQPPEFELVMFFESQAALSAEPTVSGGTTPAPAGVVQPAGDAAATPTPAPGGETSSTTTPVSTQEGTTP